MAIDIHSKPKRLLIVEVKRMSDRQEDYWLQGAELAEQQYADLCEGIRNSLPPTWECCFVPIILGSIADAWARNHVIPVDGPTMMRRVELLMGNMKEPANHGYKGGAQIQQYQLRISRSGCVLSGEANLFEKMT